MTIVRLLYAIVVVLSYIVILYPARAIFMEWAGLDTTTKKGQTIFIIIGAVMVIISAAASIGIPSISTIMNWFSSIFGTVVYWCIPALAIWVVPRIHAYTTVPKTDAEEEVEQHVAETRGRSLS